ncbi:DNA-binding protein [soil metagenome]
MIEYEFKLTFSLDHPGQDPGAFVDALGEAGCNDALVGIGRPGSISLEFARAARSADQAVASAIRDVRKAIPGAMLVEAAPDFVGLTDVADIIGVSRQQMRKVMLGHPADFPEPVHAGSGSIWHLSSVLVWLRDRQARAIDPRLLEVAKATMALNIANETRKLSGATLPPRLAALFR